MMMMMALSFFSARQRLLASHFQPLFIINKLQHSASISHLSAPITPPPSTAPFMDSKTADPPPSEHKPKMMTMRRRMRGGTRMMPSKKKKKNKNKKDVYLVSLGMRKYDDADKEIAKYYDLLDSVLGSDGCALDAMMITYTGCGQAAFSARMTRAQALKFTEYSRGGTPFTVYTESGNMLPEEDDERESRKINLQLEEESGERSFYSVSMGEEKHPRNLEEETAEYYEMLISVLGSKKAAIRSMCYVLKDGIPGFIAKMTSAQALKIEEYSRGGTPISVSILSGNNALPEEDNEREAGERDTYVVSMGVIKDPSNPEEEREDYLEMLTSVLGSKKAAVSSLSYVFKAGLPGFMARMTRDQVLRIIKEFSGKGNYGQITASTSTGDELGQPKRDKSLVRPLGFSG